MVIRERYLRRIRPFYDSELVKVIMGVRRCGKSVLLCQIRDELVVGGLNPDRILSLSFEDYANRPLLDPVKLNEYIEDAIAHRGVTHLFFDEIQLVDEFEKVVNSIRSKHDVSIFLTGSNSKLLSGELATVLGGRTIQFKMLPFSYAEYLEFLNGEGRSYEQAPTVGDLLTDYLTWGGFPAVCKERNPTEKALVLDSLYSTVVLRDIILRNKVSSPQTLESVLDYVLANSSLTVSGNRIAAALNDANRRASAPTVYDMLRHIVESCVVNRIERYDIRGRKRLEFEEKMFACDQGLLRLKKNRAKDEFNNITETAVANELISRGLGVHIGKTRSGEIDFIAESPQGRCYIQVAYLIPDETVAEREFGAFDAIDDHCPKYVVSMDPLTCNRNGVVHLRLDEFLLDEGLLRFA